MLTLFSPFRVGQAEGQVFEAKEGKRLSLAAASWYVMYRHTRGERC